MEPGYLLIFLKRDENKKLGLKYVTMLKLFARWNVLHSNKGKVSLRPCLMTEQLKLPTRLQLSK